MHTNTLLVGHYLGKSYAMSLRKKKSKAVRRYFDLEILHAIPVKPSHDYETGKACGLSNDEWVAGRCEILRQNIQGALPSGFDEIKLIGCEPVLSGAPVYKLRLVVSKCHRLADSEFYHPKKGYSGFKIRRQSLLRLIKSVRDEITRFLGEHYCVLHLEEKYVTSRYFVFEMYFSGNFVVEHKFTPEEICDHGGVKAALANFVDEVESSLYPHSFSVFSPGLRRRNINDRYEFNVSTTRYFGFGEDQVVGDMSSVTQDMSLSEVQAIGIDNLDDCIRSTELDVCGELGEQFLNLPIHIKIISCDMNWIDQDDDVYEIDQELL